MLNASSDTRPSPASLVGRLASGKRAAMDGIWLHNASLVPEIRLYLADDANVLWARLGAQLKAAVAPPYWASAWAGGQALARYVLDNQDVVRGKRVLDVGSGSGIVAIAAALAGAESVIANDIDPMALSVICLNAAANEVSVDVRLGDIVDSMGVQADVVLAGDMFYGESVADNVLRFMRHRRQSGAEILVGDPGRGFLPEIGMELLTTYPFSGGVSCDAQYGQAQVFRLRSIPPTAV